MRAPGAALHRLGYIDALRGYAIKSAQQLGVNLLAYATAQQAWAKQAAHAMQFVDQDNGSASKMFVAQVIYNGEWKTRHAGLSVLLHQFNQKTDIPVKYAVTTSSSSRGTSMR
jgi:hypothetical protein